MWGGANVSFFWSGPALSIGLGPSFGPALIKFGRRIVSPARDKFVPSMEASLIRGLRIFQLRIFLIQIAELRLMHQLARTPRAYLSTCSDALTCVCFLSGTVSLCRDRLPLSAGGLVGWGGCCSCGVCNFFKGVVMRWVYVGFCHRIPW